MLEVAHNYGVYTISMRPANTLLQHRPSLICLIHDDTELKAAIKNLKEKNEKLVMMNNSIKMLQDQISQLATIEKETALQRDS